MRRRRGQQMFPQDPKKLSSAAKSTRAAKLIWHTIYIYIFAYYACSYSSPVMRKHMRNKSKNSQDKLNLENYVQFA